MSTKANVMCVVPPKRRPGYAGFALAPAAARRRSRRVFNSKMEIRMPKPGPDRYEGRPRHRDAPAHIDNVERGSP